jgi:hypothetical protein
MTDHDQPTALQRLFDLASAAGGSLVGYALGGPEGALVGGATPAAVNLALHAGNAAVIARLTRGSRALDVAANHLDSDLDSLAAQAASDPARLELTARVLEAAGRTPLAEKIPALGRVLAAGLDPAGSVDLALKLATALDDLEAPDVQVLDLLDRQTSAPAPEREGVGWTSDELRGHLPGHRLLIAAILRTLDRHALIRDANRGTWEDLEGSDRWTVSELGQHCLALLRDQE